MALTFRGNLGGRAYAEYDMYVEPVQVGDRMVPEHVIAVFPSEDAPTIRIEVSVRAGVPECRRLEILSTDDGRDVRPLDLRAIQLDTLISRIYAATVVRSRETPDGGRSWVWHWHSPEEAMAAQRDMERARVGRPRKLSDQRIRKAAEIYREHVNDRPTEAVAAAFGVAHRTATKYVTEARARGFLPPTTPGKIQA